jgi:alkylated DNA nucleotide flippase Atl1
VIGAGGRIRLTGEAGLEQQLRLRMEGVLAESGRVDMERFGHRFRTRAPRG